MVEAERSGPGKDLNTMKLSFIRIFALTMLANSVLAFGASSPYKDEKLPAACSPQAAAEAVPQSGEDQQCDKKMKKEKEKKTKKKVKEQKQDDNYPGYGIYG